MTSLCQYRTPRGAAPLGVCVSIGIDIWGLNQNEVLKGVYLRTWHDSVGEQKLAMKHISSDDTNLSARRLYDEKHNFGQTHTKAPAEALHFSCDIEPEHVGLTWYFFIIQTNFAHYTLGAHAFRTSGEALLRSEDEGEPPAFQLTVYKPAAERPAWTRDAILYQIFPDRFARDAAWQERGEHMIQHAGGVERTMEPDWSKTPSYLKDEQGRLARWDFYGGSLAGIREHLDHIQALGANTIYLNPIFAAYSNHRYDTANYFKIDELLGTTEDFKELADEIHRRGMHLILDGVFNHTGIDSIYFNKLNAYPEPGAWQGPQSKYFDWFKIHEDGSYDCWWGVADLPAVNEKSASYQDFIYGPEGVVAHWLELGADGWRLDVADELPDDFVEHIYARVKETKADAQVIGEVWEDASRKISYDEKRRYVFGKELDAVMNYPFRNIILGLLSGDVSAQDAAAQLNDLINNYPHDFLAQSWTLLSSHDRPRLMQTLTDLDPTLAKPRFWIACVLQMLLPGTPHIYYGDEYGLMGAHDPENRATMPWDHTRQDADCYTMYQRSIALRHALPYMADAETQAIDVGDKTFAFWRFASKKAADSYEARLLDERMCVLLNVGQTHETDHITLQVRPGYEHVNLINGQVLEANGSTLTVDLNWLELAVILERPKRVLAQPTDAGLGVLAHITSIPGGTLGAPARSFIDWLAKAGVRAWQMLPISPADQFGSPYAGLSAFAGNTLLLDMNEAELIDSLIGAEKQESYQQFVQKEAAWLEPYALFWATKELFGGTACYEWPEPYRHYSPVLAHDPKLQKTAERMRRLQFAFQLEWEDMRSYAHQHNIKLIGDIPLYVSADSADAWAHPELFELDVDGRAKLVAGAPPDPFSATGQVWGNPCFKWDAMRADNFAWWRARMARQLELFDSIRLDHFIGFINYFAIPHGGTGLDGHYQLAPGTELMLALARDLGELPVIAEDLGLITPAVHALAETCGIPGMDVVQFANANTPEDFAPAPHAVAYSGTHDTQTVLGFTAGDKNLANRYLKATIEGAQSLCILALQDVLGLDDASRMNVPNTCEGNWMWHASADQLESSAATLADFVKLMQLKA